jgi:hypothetical protein
MAAAQEREVVPFHLYHQGQVDAIRERYEQKLKEQADANRRRAEHDSKLVLDLQSQLLREQDRVVRLQKKLLAIRELFNFED